MYDHRLGDHDEVVVALDGDQAVDALDDAVDVVTLDRRMPNVTGDENFYGGPDETRSAPRGD